jgi:YidC/Oxa1 family membrane protein insertase
MESIFDILYIPMGYILRFAYTLTHNYLFAILLFTLVFEILLFPLAVKQQKNQIKQASLAPRTAAIRKKYAGRTDKATQQKMQQEIMDMYQAEHFNPASGCGTLLIQMPIIICLYNVVMRPLRYISNVPTAEITALKTFLADAGVEINIRSEQISIINAIRDNVSNYYTIAPSLQGAVLPVFKVGPFDLSQILRDLPNYGFMPFNWLVLIPLLTFVVMIVSQKIMQKFTYQDPTMAEQQNNMSMKIMQWTTPLISVYFEFQLAAAVGVYWMFRNALMVVSKIVAAKLYPLPKLTEEDYKEAERVAGLSNKQKKREAKERDPDRKPVRSLHHIDDDDYNERLEAAEKKEEEEAAGREDRAPVPLKDDEQSDYRKKE